MSLGTGIDRRSRLRRCLEAIALVALLIAIGEIFRPGIITYLLLTIPATAAFQLLVRHRHLQDLWVRDGPKLERRTIGLVVAIALSVVPLITLIRGRFQLDEVLYLLAAVIGAFVASYALRQGSRATLRDFALCMATAGLIGAVLLVSHEIFVETQRWTRGAAGQPSGLVPLKPLFFFQQWLILFPVSFLMEEVTFRGALDSHVHHAGERFGVLSAIFVSLLWGLWHLPTLSASLPLAQRIVAVLPLQLAVGPFLSLWWRRSGNLSVTAGTHAFIDALRNALGITP